MFQTGFPPITRSSKLHIQRQVIVRPILLPAASQAKVYVQFLAPDDGRKNRLKHVERLTEIKKLWNVASCWLYSENTKLSIYFWCKHITLSSLAMNITILHVACDEDHEGRNVLHQIVITYKF